MMRIPGWAAIGCLLCLAGCGGPRLVGGWSGGGTGTGYETGTAAPGTYVVQRGDTLYRIATTHGLPVRRMIEVNHLSPPYTLMIGQVLRIPVNTDHVVKAGETLKRVAQIHHVDWTELARANGISPPYVIRVGQVLRLPGAEAPVQSVPIAAESPPAPSGTEAAPSAPDSMPSLESSAATVAAVPHTEAAPLPEPPKRSGRALDWPVRGKVVLPFGPIAKGLNNDGINIAARKGTAVHAAESGVVAYAGNELKGFGNLLLLKHDGGLMTTYAHLADIRVKRGEVVKRGEIIAEVGQTGNVSSPQIHFEVRQGAKPVDPQGFLPRD